MNTNELKKFIAAGQVDRIVFLPLSGSMDGQWVVYAYGRVYMDGEVQQDVIEPFGNQLVNTSRDMLEKTFSSLDRAYGALRKMGYEGVVIVNGK